MSLISLLHNPKAGDEDHSGDRLKDMIESAGYDCRYVSTKAAGWEHFDPQTSFIAVAGGDGTVRKLVKALLETGKEAAFPVAVLPSGTANNIARSLRIEDSHETIIKDWQSCPVQKVDIGRLNGLEFEHFFLESFGFGLLPRLMKEMEKLNEKQMGTPEEELEVATRLLHDITLDYDARYCKVIIDGTDYSGKYLMVEVLNMAFVGPNLNMAPESDPGDGLFETVLIAEEGRPAFARFVLDPENNPLHQSCLVIKGQQFQLHWDGADMHADDELLTHVIDANISISAEKDSLSFLV